MKETVLYGPRDVRFEERETPKIEQPADAVIRIAATCVNATRSKRCCVHKQK